jgi:hypothetical protein
MSVNGESGHEPTSPRRTRPLAVLIGSDELILLGDDVNALLESVDKLVAATYESLRRSGADGSRVEVSQHAIAELESLGEALTTSGARLADPPVEIDHERARLLKKVLADLDGYQRRELTPGLVELRRQLATLA